MKTRLAGDGNGKGSKLGLTLNLASLNVVRNVLGATAVNLAAGGEGSTEDLLDGTLEVLGHGLEAHGAGNVDDLIKRDRLGVLDVLLLLAVTRRLLEGLDDERRGGGDDRDSGLTVLDGELDGDAKTLPVAGGLGDIFTDLLGRETKRTDLGGKSGRGTDLTTSGTEVDDLDLAGIELGSCITQIYISLALLDKKPPLRKDDTYAWLVRKVVGLFRKN